MKNLKVAMWVGALLLLQSFGNQKAFGKEGVGSSGGGSSVVCRNPSGQITSAILLDLYEAVLRFKVKLRQPVGELDREYAIFLNRIRKAADDNRPVGPSEIKNFHDNLQQYFYFIPQGTKLERISDLGKTPPLSPGCQIEQAAVFRDKEMKIYVDSEIWKALDSLNKVALYSHEVFYKMYRDAGDETSENIRHLMALWSLNLEPPRATEGIPQNAMKCMVNNNPSAGYSSGDPGTSWFAVYPNPKAPNQTIIQFLRVVGHDTYSPTRIILPIQIDSGKLKADWTVGPQGPRGVILASDPNLQLDQVFPLQSVIFDHYRIAFRYRYGEPVQLALIGPKGNIIRAGSIRDCGASVR